MKRFRMSRAAAVAAPILVAAPSGFAAEGGLIWAPKKISDRAYSARIGMRLPVDSKVEAGLEVGMTASSTNALVDTPVRFWTDVNIGSGKSPASSYDRNLGVVMNALNGNVAFRLARTTRYIATPSLDLETSRDVLVRYEGHNGSWRVPDVNQTLKLDRKESGTAIFVRAAGTEAFSTFAASTGIEQKLGDSITLSGAVQHGNNGNTGSVNARYNIRW